MSGEEPYHGCTDIKPLLLLLLRLCILIKGGHKEGRVRHQQGLILLSLVLALRKANFVRRNIGL